MRTMRKEDSFLLLVARKNLSSFKLRRIPSLRINELYSTLFDCSLDRFTSVATLLLSFFFRFKRRKKRFPMQQVERQRRNLNIATNHQS